MKISTIFQAYFVGTPHNPARFAFACAPLFVNLTKCCRRFSICSLLSSSEKFCSRFILS